MNSYEKGVIMPTEIDLQFVINGFFGVIAFFAGWVINLTLAALKELQIADKELAEKVAHIEILVTGDYIKKLEFERLSDALIGKLDKIESKLDKKADISSLKCLNHKGCDIT